MGQGVVKQDHSDCIEHFKLEGYAKKICVLTGQNKEDVVQFAKEMLRIKNEANR